MTGTVYLAGKALETEIFAAAIYDYLATGYSDGNMRLTLAEIAKMEKGHVLFWSEFLKRRGVDTAGLKSPGLKLFLYKVMLKLIGRSLTLRIMETDENQAIEMYSSIQTNPELNEEERKALNGILGDELVHENMLSQEESKFEGFTGYIKDAVLGMSDGLVEILSVTTGLVGVSGSPAAVAISGLVVGIAGALSMGISTYTSTRSQRQVHEGMLKRIVSAARFVGHIFKERVMNRLQERGYSKRLSGEIVEETSRDYRLLSSLVAEQEYGLREEKLGNPSTSAMYAGLSNLFAAFSPLLPYFFVSDITLALVLSLVLATIALAVTGLFVSIIGYMPPGRKVGEMILTGLGSAGVTYLIGRVASILLGRPV